MSKKTISVLLSVMFLLPLAGGEVCGQTRDKENVLDRIEASGDFAPMFPFQPTHDAPLNITNVSTWDGFHSQVAGDAGFIRAEGDRFVDGSGAERRFIGTNICFSGCFPEKEDAERVAEELTRYGINLVRLHYVHHKAPAGRIYPEKDSFIEPEQLDRFDYLFAQLKERGIYTYFQLNIGRKFSEVNGFVNASKLPWYNNGIDNVDERMISLHKKYTTDILSHVNPYTGLAYKDDPAIGMMEIANENSIVNAWFSPKYDFPNIVEPYRTDLKNKWNKWLAARYKNTAALKKAWSEGLEGDGHEFITDGVFGTERPGTKWNLQKTGPVEAALTFEASARKDGLKGKSYFAVHIDKASGTMPQFYRSKIRFREGEPLTLTLKARAHKPTTVQIRFSQNHNPWHVAGLKTKMTLSTQWTEYKYEFKVPYDDEDVRLVISNFEPGTVEVADVSLVSGIERKWPSGWKLENKSVELPSTSDWSLMERRALDFTEFLGALEENYFSQMRLHIKKSIGAGQCVTGTQLQYGFDHPEAEMDYCDIHSYWCHPVFPVKAWDGRTMLMRNVSLLDSGGGPGQNLRNLARCRILGKPFTVSEYDHPNLNFYSAEGNLMATAFGAFQDWSAFIQFAWTHNSDFFREVMSPRFDLCSSTAKLVHFPACYAMFIRGDVRKGDGPVVVKEADKGQETSVIAARMSPRALKVEKNKVLDNLPLIFRTGKTLREFPETAVTGEKISSEADVPDVVSGQLRNGTMRSSTGEILWSRQSEGDGYFMVDTPQTKVFSGFVKGRSFKFEGMTLTPGRTRLDWLTLSLTRAMGTETSSGRLAPGTYLLAVTGLCHNTGAVLVDMGKSNISGGVLNGGNYGTGPVLCEGIDAELVFAGLGGKVKCYALDPSGARKAELPVTGETDASIHVAPGYRTVWYELEIR